MVGFPLLLIPVALYNIIVFLMPSVSFSDALVQVPLVSGAEWSVTLTDVLLALGILLLLLEVIKGARPGAKYFMDHLLSLILFGCAAVEFVMWPRFGNSTFFLLTLLTLADFLSGTALHVRRGRGVVAAPVAPQGNVVPPKPPVTEPHFNPPPASEPEPEPASSAPVAEPVPAQPSEPKSEEAQPASNAASSAEVASPELQPGHAAPSPEEPKH
jgi:hypothetical protein